jgi:hypothetical protein
MSSPFPFLRVPSSRHIVTTRGTHGNPEICDVRKHDRQHEQHAHSFSSPAPANRIHRSSGAIARLPIQPERQRQPIGSVHRHLSQVRPPRGARPRAVRCAGSVRHRLASGRRFGDSHHVQPGRAHRRKAAAERRILALAHSPRARAVDRDFQPSGARVSQAVSRREIRRATRRRHARASVVHGIIRDLLSDGTSRHDGAAASLGDHGGTCTHRCAISTALNCHGRLPSRSYRRVVFSSSLAFPFAAVP